MFWLFGHEARGILIPWSGIEPATPKLEGEVLTAGPPGKSLYFLFWNCFINDILYISSKVTPKEVRF